MTKKQRENWNNENTNKAIQSTAYKIVDIYKKNIINEKAKGWIESAIGFLNDG